jgi:hypothetical protein
MAVPRHKRAPQILKGYRNEILEFFAKNVILCCYQKIKASNDTNVKFKPCTPLQIHSAAIFKYLRVPAYKKYSAQMLAFLVKKCNFLFLANVKSSGLLKLFTKFKTYSNGMCFRYTFLYSKCVYSYCAACRPVFMVAHHVVFG